MPIEEEEQDDDEACMSESVFNHDFGLITKEEFDNFKLNTRNDLELKADFGVKVDIDDDYEQEYIGGYFGYISTVTKLSQCLGVTKLEEYTALLGTKYFQPESFVLPDHQILLDQYERKILSSTKKQRKKIINKQQKQRHKYSMAGQRIKVKGTDQTGRCIMSSLGDPTGKHGNYPIILDKKNDHDNDNDRVENGNMMYVTRDEVDFICHHCNEKVATKKCDRCHRVWYCSRECQIRDWKKGGHRNVCKEYELATTISSNSNNNSSNDNDDDEGEEGDNSNSNRKSNDDEGEEGTSRQLVKIVATEQIGTCIGRPLTSTPATSSDEDSVLSHVGGIGGTITKYPIIIDGGTDIENDDEICITLFERNEFDPMCYRCNILDGTKKRCSKCKQVWYCGAACQLMDWKKRHRTECKRLVEQSNLPPQL